ncbi:MAG: hypothetical protein PHG63_01995 [Candidatus Dojkabacteria bacterium]|nr:hypothetical protein [Candidatus Dojkabacteria bacterium]
MFSSGQTTALTQPRRVFISSQAVIDEIVSFFHWWYIEMPSRYVGLFHRILVISDDTLSISLLIRTIFVPWHRDPSWVGRGFGIAMRLLYLPFAMLLTLTCMLILAVCVILWAVLPGISLIFLLKTPFT